MQQIADWLEKLGMSEYTQRFTENRIDFSVLPDLTDQDLKDIGVVLGDRRKILRAIAKTDVAPEAAALEPVALSSLSVAAMRVSPIEEKASERDDVRLDEIVRDTSGGHPRTNYRGLIASAVKALDGSTAEARQVIYDRARKALIAHLRCNQLGLSQAVITEERLALEDAIRKVEAEAAHNSRTEMLTEPQPAIPSVGTPSGGAAFEPLRQGNGVPDARGQQLNGPSSTEGEAVIVREVHDFDAVTPRVMQTAPPTRGAYEEEAIEPILDPYDLYWFELDTPQKRDREDAYAADDERVTTLPQVRATRNAASDAERMRRSPSYGALATLLVALIMVVGLAAAVFWEWSPITQFYVFLSHTGLKPQSQVSQKTPSAQPKLLERVPQQQSSVETPGTTAPGGQTATTQRVVLYEENPADPQGKRYSGAVVWRTETFSAGPGLARLAVRAVVTIPELRMAVIWALRHSADKAAYTIETTFNLPADFPGGGIANVPGILMKQSEQARGTPLAGLAVKVMNGFFIIGLSADETDAQRNEQLLKERSWFDIPIVYTNGGRAILAIEKGPSGDRAFGEAFDAWEKK